jgi:hypothetical protein
MKTNCTIIRYNLWNGSYLAYHNDDLIARGDTIEECREQVFEWIDEKREANLLRKLAKKKAKIHR